MCIGLTLEVYPSGLCKVEEDGDRLHCDYSVFDLPWSPQGHQILIILWRVDLMCSNSFGRISTYIYEVPISLKWVHATVLGLVNFVQVRRNVVICRSFEIELWYIHDCRKCGLWNTDIYWSWKYSWFLINLIDNGVWMISLSREVMQTVIYGT